CPLCSRPAAPLLNSLPARRSSGLVALGSDGRAYSGAVGAFFGVSWPVVSDSAGSPVFDAAVSAAVGGGDSADVGDGWPADHPLSPAPRAVGVAVSRVCVADRFVPEPSDSAGGRARA